MREFRPSNQGSFFWTVFPILFGFVFVGILLAFVASVFLGVQCYLGNDPNSMACFMISDRHEIGIRNR